MPQQQEFVLELGKVGKEIIVIGEVLMQELPIQKQNSAVLEMVLALPVQGQVK
jgi:hypothetical protein